MLIYYVLVTLDGFAVRRFIIGTHTRQDVLKYLKLSGPLVGIGDLHEPFASKQWKRWVVQQVKDRQPAYVVQVGDTKDFYCFSKFSRSHSIMTPKQEILEGRKRVEDFWAEVTAAAPKAKRYQLLGNHDVRPIKRILEAVPEAEHLIDWEKMNTYDGVKTQYDEKDELILGKLFCHHGHKRHGDHARYNQAPTMVGHLHTGGVVYYQNRYGPYFELNVGYGGDPASDVFNYRYQRKIHGWTQGLGVIDSEGPKFLLYK